MMKIRSSKRKAALAVLAAAALLQAGPYTVHGNAGHVQASDYRGHWSEPLIKSGIQNGILQGYEDGSFRPEHAITRAELAVLLDRAFWASKEAATVSLADVPPGAWYETAAIRAVASGYLKTDHDGSFHPERPVTRAEVAGLLAGLLHWEATAVRKENAYKDSSFLPLGKQGDWLLQAVSRGFLQASVDGFLLPFKPLSRSEALLAVAVVKGTNPQGVREAAFTAVQELEGTLKDAGQGFVLRVAQSGGGIVDYALSPEKSLSGTSAIAGIDGTGVKVTAVAGLLPDRLAVLGIGPVHLEDSLEEWEGVLLEGHHSNMTDPGKHKKLCLLMPDCAASGFGVSVLQADGTYKYYKFDEKGHQLAAVLIDSLTKESNVVIHATGTIEGDILHVTRLSQNIGDITTAGINTDGEAIGHEDHSETATATATQSHEAGSSHEAASTHEKAVDVTHHHGS